MKKVLVIPHVGISGGAGLYINQVVSELEKKYEVYFGGHYSYDFNSTEYIITSDINKIIIPYYKGISARAYFFYFFKSLLYIPRLFLDLKKKNNDKDFKIVLLTSGIQVLLLPIINRLFKDAKVVVLIQENFRLDGYVLGKIVEKNFLKADLIVSITNDWKSYSKSYGIESFLFRNMYNCSLDIMKTSVEKYFDFIYLGGEQKIKGFSDVISFCQEMSKIKSFRIAILGEVSKESKRMLLDIANNSEFTVDITFFGFLKNVTDVIRRSKLLLLPITSPHFCRPAIEAGFEKVPFLIRRHNDISDFAIENYNCEMYDSLEEMLNKSTLFLEDKSYTEEMGLNNYKVSTNFIYNKSIADDFIKAVEGVLE